MTPGKIKTPFGPFKEGQDVDVTFITGQDGQVFAIRFLDPVTNHVLTMPASFKDHVLLHANENRNSQGQ